ncbi:carbonic anhydrase [Amycolatopsis sp. lyj-23]|uniref:carbonic anhydrase n=1 Tax=Amycolatopsis sp. lyj-23 TaxID=2789283 RepID=UPI00397BFE92
MFDSRPAAEFIFDRGLGDLFVLRTAGHVARLRSAGQHRIRRRGAGLPASVVLGHDSCGAAGSASAGLQNGATPSGYIQGVV